MSINFDKLPTEKPEGFALPPEGFTKVTITKPVIKTSKAGNKYLDIQLKTPTGQIIWDKIMDSDTPALQYKLARFITACKLPLVGEITLEDLGRVVNGKEVVADIVHKENTWKDKTTTKAEVEIFANDVYYPIEDYATLVPDSGQEAPPIDMTPGTY